MNGFQSAIKIFAICLAIFIIVNIFGWIIFGVSFLAHFGDNENIENSEIIDVQESFSETYENVDRIDIDIAYSKLYIKVGNELKVEARRNEKQIFF
ncbi:MAG: hypothetical protein HFJ54_07745 [Clostridia bacterium]|nr:hypothetical protein [Clostridia bacterium]